MGAARVVMVVEDEIDIRETLADILELAGYTVETAASGPEAMARLGGRAYDAIVSDVRMPGMNGMDLFRLVVQEDAALAARFVLVTGDSLDAAVQSFLAETAVPVIAKPFSPSDVRRVVAAVTARVHGEP